MMKIKEKRKAELNPVLDMNVTSKRGWHVPTHRNPQFTTMLHSTEIGTAELH